MSARLGVDVGGTFTDLVVIDESTGSLRVGKVLTTPKDPAHAVEAGSVSLLGEAAVAVADVRAVVHGTTLATNALIERKGARTALLTTEGFRDAVEIRHEGRYDMYDLFIEPPAPLVPRHLRREVPERLLADGSVLRPLDEEVARRVIRAVLDEGVEAVAICLLHAYVNPVHERRLAELVREFSPALPVSCSSDVVPEIREYERASTTAANVYVAPLMARYIADLESRLVERSISGQLYIMQSSGGIALPPVARRLPIRLVESGPAAGALAAAQAARQRGELRMLSFDMGGTTAKACVIDDGAPLVAREFEVARADRFKRGSGLPVRVPVIELIEIGAGGGSLARVDRLGLLKVGPDSAGADPGPACYNLGGRLPTVTDADLLLGYLDADFFLGGRMPLDREAARRAIEEHVARPLGLDVVEAARGIHRVVNENMAAAARIHGAERGKDLRNYPLFAFGGAGPVHCWQVARILGIPRILLPFGAGAISAYGLLAAPLAFDFVRTTRQRLDKADWRAINDLFDGMESEGRALLVRAGVREDDIRVARIAEMRYVGQGHEVEATIPAGVLDANQLATITASFETAYRALYHRLPQGMAIEALNWRVTVSGPAPAMPAVMVTARRRAHEAVKGRRPAYFEEAGGFVETPVYDRYALAPGDRFGGPAIVEERESTAVIGPGAECRVDDALALIVKPSAVGEATGRHRVTRRAAARTGALRGEPSPSMRWPRRPSRTGDMMDPVTLEVCWSRLIGVVNEQAAALQRTSFTSIVREAGDLSAGVFDRRGYMVAQAVTGTPGHINSMALAMRHFLAAYPLETLRPGDVLITNDPWQTSGHLNDVTICSPIFRRDDCIAFFMSTCHTADIGGHVLSAEAREVYEEGLQIPIMKLYDAGEPNESLMKIIRANVRLPEMVLGDFHAQMAGGAVGGERLLEFMDEFGLSRLEPLSDAIIARTERAMREAIRALRPGAYAYEMISDGFDEPIAIRVRCEARGDELLIDYAGSSAASRRGVNVVMNYTEAYTTYGVKVVVSPDVPNNEGAFRPLRITAPADCILNAQRPAAVAARHVIGHFLPHVIAGALGQALPERVMAEGSANIWGIQISGKDLADWPFSYVFFSSGGTGARAGKDGLSATAFPSGVLGTPVEVIENLSPLVLERKALRDNSGGSGRYRGGLGQVISFRVRSREPVACSILGDRTLRPAQGFQGGGPGALGEVLIDGVAPHNPKSEQLVAPGALVEVRLPGGGGYGPLSERDAELIAADLREGYATISPSA
jgi:N-methylhydantoinase A/oxoprolinase/acetone carboxylase beta subunit/N-methylhydantoinase B/oxoprolinase/acetone carboxylase alpha subunit